MEKAHAQATRLTAVGSPVCTDGAYLDRVRQTDGEITEGCPLGAFARK